MTAPALRHRRLSPLAGDLVLERTVCWDEAQGVFLLAARRRAKQPTTEQLKVHARLQQLRDAIEAGEPEPVVRWVREGLRQRLIRNARRALARRALAGPARLEGLSS